MNRQKLTFSIIAVAMIAGTALLLAAVPQKLGPPGVKASPITGSVRWQIDLPEQVLDYASENHDPDTNALAMLPPDTSIGERIYYRPGSPPILAGVVLMGTDRTSIHKADYCLQGMGMHIDEATRQTVQMHTPQPYDLPVVKILTTYSKSEGGKSVTKRYVYVYWYVADGILSNDRSGFGRMWSMAKGLVFTGVLQRWAYVRFYASCDPGQEDATFEQLKQLITACVPRFQLTPKPTNATASMQQ